MDKEFFCRSADIVAKELLGKILIRRIGNKELNGRIVETEAYFDEKDPASRACKNGDLKETMKMKAGTILVYGVHNNWLVNFVTGNYGEASAVLIRAIKPINGLAENEMKTENKIKMKTGILFSGGKDSCYAAFLAKKEGYEISCLIAIESQNKESYMFHTPFIDKVFLQASLMNIPLVYLKTKGEKEKELSDLEKAIKIAIKKYKING